MAGSGNPQQKMPNQLRLKAKFPWRFYMMSEKKHLNSSKFLNQPNPSSTSSGLITPHSSMRFVHQPTVSWWNTDEYFESIAWKLNMKRTIQGCPIDIIKFINFYAHLFVDRSERDAIEKKFKEDRSVKRSWTLRAFLLQQGSRIYLQCRYMILLSFVIYCWWFRNFG